MKKEAEAKKFFDPTDNYESCLNLGDFSNEPKNRIFRSFVKTVVIFFHEPYFSSLPAS